MNLLDFSNKTGWPASASTWQFMQEQMLQLQLLSLLGGTNYIVSGCVVTGSNVSNGIVVINGEVMPLVGGSVQPTVTVNEVGTSRAFKDGVPRSYYKNRFASFGLGTTNYTWADFERNDPSNGVLKRLRLAEQLLTSVGSAITGINTTLGTKADKSNVLQKDNATVYSPSQSYHPATKAYVDAKLAGTVWVSGLATNGNTITKEFGMDVSLSVAQISEGRYRITHFIGHINYGVSFYPRGVTNVKPCGLTKANDSFDVTFADDMSYNNCDFYFQIFKYPA